MADHRRQTAIEPERDDSPAEAHLLFEQPLADARGIPDAMRGRRRAADARPAEPDSSTISRCSGTGRHEGTRRPRGSRRTARAAYHAYADPADGDERRELPTVMPSRRIDRVCACATVPDEPVRGHGDRRDDGRDQAAVEVRERHGQRRGAQESRPLPARRRRDNATARASTAASTASARCEGDRRRAPDGTARTRRPSPRWSRPPARAPDDARADTPAAADSGKLRRTSQLYAATPPESRAIGATPIRAGGVASPRRSASGPGSSDARRRPRRRSALINCAQRGGSGR